MATVIRDFQELEKEYQQNPKIITQWAAQWGELANQYPETEGFTTFNEFLAWANAHDIQGADSYWRMREMILASPEFRQAQQQQTTSSQPYMPTTNGAIGIASALPLFFAKEPPARIMQEDKRYAKIAEEVKAKWLAAHPGKDFTSLEGIQFLYGSLDGKTPSLLHEETQQQFRADPKNKWAIDHYDKQETQYRYKADWDAQVQYTKAQIEEHYNAQAEYFKKAGLPFTKEAIRQQVEQAAWDQFVKDHPEKAATYAKQNTAIDNALQRKLANTQNATQRAPVTTSQAPHSPTQNQSPQVSRQFPHISTPIPLSGSMQPARPVSPTGSLLSNASRMRTQGMGSSAINSANRLRNMGRQKSQSLQSTARNVEKDLKRALRLLRFFATPGGSAVFLIALIFIFVFAIGINIFNIGGGSGTPPASTGPTPTPTPTPITLSNFVLSSNALPIYGSGQTTTVSFSYTYNPRAGDPPLNRIYVYIDFPLPNVVYVANSATPPPTVCYPGPKCDHTTTRAVWDLGSLSGNSFSVTVTNSGSPTELHPQAGVH